jgi:TRAP-type C4-dicarboxylate transport system permease small subunit
MGVVGDGGGTNSGPATGPGDSVRLVRVAGVLLLTGSVFSIPGGIVIEPTPPLTDYWVSLTAATIAAGLLLAPSGWITRAWVYLSLVVGVVLIAVAVGVFSDDYAFFYVITAIYAALALRRKKEVLGYAALLTVALLAPLVYDDRIKEQLHHIFVVLPVLLISALLVVYLRENLERNARNYAQLAGEADALASRIHRSVGTHPRPR